MKLAMRLPAKALAADNDRDPREGESAEIIDLASRTATTYRNAGASAGRPANQL